MTEVLAALSYGAASAAAGGAVMHALGTRMRGGPATATAVVLTGFVLGQGVLSQVMMVAGLLLPFNLVTVLSIVGMFALAGGTWLPRWSGDLRTGLRAAAAHVRVAPHAQSAALALAVLYALLLGAAALTHPPWGDAEALYLAYPKFMVAAGQVEPFRGGYESVSSIGLVGELNFAALMMIGGPGAAKLFAWMCGIAALLCLVELTRRAGGDAWGRIIVAIMALTSTAFVWQTVTGKVDLVAAALGLCAVYWAVMPAASGRSPYTGPRLAGLAGGLACVAKLSYAPTLVPVLVLLVTLRSRAEGEGASRTMMHLANVALTAGLAVVPHLVKNAIFFGEPFAPFITASPNRAWHESNRSWYGPQATTWIVLTYPLALVFGKYPMQEGTLSFLWLAFLPFMALLRRGDGANSRNGALQPDPRFPSGIVLGAAGAIGVAIWLLLRPSVLAPRYLMPALLLLFIPVALGFERALGDWRVPRALRAVSVSLLFVALFMRIAPLAEVDLNSPHGAFRINPVAEARYLGAYAIGRLPECQRASDHCRAFGALNADAAPNDRVFVATFQTYWMRPDLLLCRNTGRDEATVLGAPDSAIWETLASLGFRYAAVHTVTSRELDQRLLSAPVPPSMRVDVLPNGGSMRIYRLRGGAPATRATACAGPAGRGVAAGRQVQFEGTHGSPFSRIRGRFS